MEGDRGDCWHDDGADAPAPAVFISWVRFHGRSDGLARALGIRAWFAPGAALPHPRRYVSEWRQTAALLRAERPQVLLVMQPPIFALWSVWRYARRNGARIAGDLHTGTFDDPRWPWARRHTFRLLRKYGLAIVTNDALKAVVESHGCPAISLHDLIEVRELDPSPFVDVSVAPKAPFVLVPLAYDYDEPVKELLAAAASTPGVCWVLTGNPPRKVRRGAPTNVFFPGYVTNDDYVRLISRANAVVAVTSYENTMQRAAYEALSFGRPLVTSNTQVLTDYYESAAEIVAPRSAAIAAGVVRAVSDDTAVERMTALRTQKIGEQKLALDALREWMRTGEVVVGLNSITAEGGDAR
jgi:glycosyltransferase involved in cell wall biosynthesis